MNLFALIPPCILFYYTFSVIKIVHVLHRKALSKSGLYETATGSQNLELTAIKTEPSL